MHALISFYNIFDSAIRKTVWNRNYELCLVIHYIFDILQSFTWVIQMFDNISHDYAVKIVLFKINIINPIDYITKEYVVYAEAP